MSEAGYDALAAIVRDRIEASGRRPFLLAVTGGVAAGKSTVALGLRARLVDRWSVDVVPADGFLFSNAELDRRGLSLRKGFPASHDLGRLARFLAEVRAGAGARAPAYSHVTYDLVPGGEQVVAAEVVVVEGLPLLQREISGSFDLSIYVDADEPDLERWYVDRFLALREAARDDEASFFYGFVARSEEETAAIAHEVWRTINGPNTREHVLPTRERADVIVTKGADHSLRSVSLREGGGD